MNSYVKVKIEGKNVNNYLKWLIKNKIELIKVSNLKHNELLLIIDYKYYDLLSKYSQTYKITIVKKYGKLRILEIIKNNIIIFFSIIVGIVILYVLSNIIFSVDIVYSDDKIVDIIDKELHKYNIKKYSTKKNYEYLNEVKEKILNDNKDILEWIEIEESGTKYIVRVVERKREKILKEYEWQSIVASKDAIITSIKASSGEKVKSINQYVKKGDTVISGIMNRPNESIVYTKAKGQIYGEVWYKVSLEYPFYYQEEKLTGLNKKVISINFLNYNIPIFGYKKYKNFKIYDKILFENNLIPFKVVNEIIHEVNVKEEIYTYEEAIKKGIEEAKKRIVNQNKSINEIRDVQVLKKENLGSSLKLVLFVSVIEDITEIKEITKEMVENRQ